MPKTFTCGALDTREESAMAEIRTDGPITRRGTPTIAVHTCKLVFFHEFSGDIRDFDPDVLRVGHWGIEVEVLEVDGADLKSSRDAVLVMDYLRW